MPYPRRIYLAALSTGGIVAIVVGAVSVIAGAFYALVEVQGSRIQDARDDFDKRVEMLDDHIGTRLSELGARLEQQIDGLGERLESKIDRISERLERVEEDHRAAS